MKFARPVLCGILLVGLVEAARAERPSAEPGYPRIGNCYGAGLGYKPWDQGRDYWSKLGLVVGGCYDLHYDWENPRWAKILQRAEENIARLRAVNPQVLVLPYVDVIEGPDNPSLPKHWWDLDQRGQRWSGWPGYLRINTRLEEVLRFNLDKVQSEIVARRAFDGVFYDCWRPDPWLVPRTAALRGGKAVVMLNAWNLPRDGFEHLNGCLAEDEFNRVIEGQVEFEDFLGRYLRWCARSRRPVATMLVGHPRQVEMNAWRWAKLTWQERTRLRDSFRSADLGAMRFGLATALMGDGYFGFDTGDMGRGDWWWYPEYDAPLGPALGAAERRPDGTWQRRFRGGLVVVNGTLYDAAVPLGGPYRDVSTGKVSSRLTLPMFDGRILLPAPGATVARDDAAPRITLAAPERVQAVELDDGIRAVQTPGGLDLRWSAKGQLQHILWHGRPLLRGGWPVAANQPFVHYRPEASQKPEMQMEGPAAALRFCGRLVEGDSQVEYVETCRVEPDNSFRLRFDFKALTDLDLRLWRHYFALPIGHYAKATARAGERTVTLSETRTKEPLLSGVRDLTVETGELSLRIESQSPLSLIDHRLHGSEEYLLATYPIAGRVAAGRTWSAELRVSVTPRRKP